jgi:hypothetical protein
MVDRRARDELAAIVERYLGEEITAFEFDGTIAKVQNRTEDQTVDAIVGWLWFQYDDLVDHKVVASKERWDWFQRVLLLLRSDGELEWKKRRRWTIRQPIAASGAVAFWLAALALGFTLPLLLVCILLGCLSAALCRWRERSERGRQQDTDFIFPFSSVSEMLGVHRRASGFAKARYPGHLRDRRIRGWLAEVGLWAQWVPGWFAFSPLVLLFQSLPEDDSRCRVVTLRPQPDDDATDVGGPDRMRRSRREAR